MASAARFAAITRSAGLPVRPKRKMSWRAFINALSRPANDSSPSLPAPSFTISVLLSKWFMAISSIIDAKEGVSQKQLRQHLGLGSCQPAWHCDSPHLRGDAVEIFLLLMEILNPPNWGKMPGEMLRSCCNECLAALVLAAPPVFVLLPFLGAPLVHVHVFSVSIVLPPDIAIVSMRPATRSNYGSSQYGCKQKRNELPEQRAHSSPFRTIRTLGC